jgi:DNA modification methylase
MEKTIGEYVEHTVIILREIGRVLRNDGVVFWNIGDSYTRNGGEPGGGNRELMHLEGVQRRMCKIPAIDALSKSKRIDRGAGRWGGGNVSAPGLKPKDLCLIPFRVAIAAQEDGWWVRSVIIWSKNNPMPESVKDRPTESHEYILLLTKSERYYWNQEAILEPIAESVLNDNRYLNPDYQTGRPERGYPGESQSHGSGMLKPNSLGRNCRSVWTFSTHPYRDAHFATFPPGLPERCIKAGTPEYGCCDKCGTPYERIIERTGHINKREPAHCPNNCDTKVDSTGWGPTTMATNEWQQACECHDSKPVPSVILDPFAGSGTTLEVATKLGRKSIGYEISTKYCELIVKRNKQMAIL